MVRLTKRDPPAWPFFPVCNSTRGGTQTSSWTGSSLHYAQRRSCQRLQRRGVGQSQESYPFDPLSFARRATYLRRQCGVSTLCDRPFPVHRPHFHLALCFCTTNNVATPTFVGTNTSHIEPPPHNFITHVSSPLVFQSRQLAPPYREFSSNFHVSTLPTLASR